MSMVTIKLKYDRALLCLAKASTQETLEEKVRRCRKLASTVDSVASAFVT